MSRDTDASVSSRRLEDDADLGVPVDRPVAEAGSGDGGDGNVGRRDVRAPAFAGRWFELVEAVLDAETRREADQTVCGRLAGADRYRAAWVAERTLERDALAVRTVAAHGTTRDHRDAVEPPTVATDGSTPWTGALEERTVQVDTREPVGPDPWEAESHQGIDDDSPDGGADPWMEDDLAGGPEQVVAVPLGDGDAAHGVLVVHVVNQAQLASVERRALRSVGAALGRTTTALRSRELLGTDGVVELSVRLEPTGSPLVAAAAEHGCELALQGHTATDEGWLVYLDVDGAAAGAVADTLSAAEAVAGSRPLFGDADGGEGGRVEVTVTDGSLVERATDAGTTPAELVVDEGVCRMTVEVPLSADTRASVARLQQVFPGLELVSCSERHGPATEPTGSAGILDELSDRQREALETLYSAGYFEWPRETTAEEVADRLDIVPSTLQGHLRKAENHVLSSLLE